MERSEPSRHFRARPETLRNPVRTFTRPYRIHLCRPSARPLDLPSRRLHLRHRHHPRCYGYEGERIRLRPDSSSWYHHLAPRHPLVLACPPPQVEQGSQPLPKLSIRHASDPQTMPGMWHCRMTSTALLYCTNANTAHAIPYPSAIPPSTSLGKWASITYRSPAHTSASGQSTTPAAG